MRLHASIRPPASVAAHLDAALRPEYAHTGQVNWIHPNHWRIHLAGFGNVVQGDAFRLGDVMEAEVGELPAPTLALSAIAALPEEGDNSIWVGVDGDRDQVADLASMIPRWALQFGFVLDRRAYRSRIQIGRITPTTSASYLESLISRLGTYQGLGWTADGVTLGHEEGGAGELEPSFEVFRLAEFADSSS